MSLEVKEYILSVQGGHHPSYVMLWWRVPHQGVTHLHFCKKGLKLVSKCIKRMCYKELWNILTWPSSVVRNVSNSRTQFLPKRPRHLRSGCEEMFWPSSPLRICFRGVQTSNPWTINCGMFWRTWRAKKCHNSLEGLRRFLLKAATDIPLETEREATAGWPEHLKACVKAQSGHFEWHCYKWKPKTIANKLFSSKSGCFV